MKTIMQQLLEELKNFKLICNSPDQRFVINYVIETTEIKIEREKQQIEESFNKGMDSVDYFLPNNVLSESEQYYQETFGNPNQSVI